MIIYFILLSKQLKCIVIINLIMNECDIYVYKLSIYTTFSIYIKC